MPMQEIIILKMQFIRALGPAQIDLFGSISKNPLQCNGFYFILTNYIRYSYSNAALRDANSNTVFPLI